MDVKIPGDSIYLLGETLPELGGSEYYREKGYLGNSVPKIRGPKAKRTFQTVTKAIDSGLVKACHDLSEGGLGVAAAEMAIGGAHGLELDLRKVTTTGLNRNDLTLFSESNSRFLIEVSTEERENFENLTRNLDCAEVGKIVKSSRLCIKGLRGNVVVDVSLADLSRNWKRTLSTGL
jgi:phosphoribosylformylglycinamidine synthase